MRIKQRLFLGAVSAVVAVALMVSGCSKKTTSSVASSAAPIVSSSQLKAIETSTASAEIIGVGQTCFATTTPGTGWFKRFLGCIEQKLNVQDKTKFENCALDEALNPTTPAPAVTGTASATASASPAAVSASALATNNTLSPVAEIQAFGELKTQANRNAWYNNLANICVAQQVATGSASATTTASPAATVSATN